MALPSVPVCPSTDTLTVEPRWGDEVDTLTETPSPVTSVILLALALIVSPTPENDPLLVHSGVAPEVPGFPSYTVTTCDCAVDDAADAVSKKNVGVVAPAVRLPSGWLAGWLGARLSTPPVNDDRPTHKSARAALLVTRYPA